MGIIPGVIGNGDAAFRSKAVFFPLMIRHHEVGQRLLRIKHIGRIDVIIASVDPDIAPFVVISHHDRRVHTGLHQQIGICRRDLAANALPVLEETQGRCIIHIRFPCLLIRFPVILIVSEKIIIQRKGLFKRGIMVLHRLVQDFFNLFCKIPNPGGSLFAGNKIGEPRHAVVNGVLAIPCVTDQFCQHRETQPGELAHDPVIGMLIRAGKRILAGHDRIHQMIPGFTHGFAEYLLHKDGADLRPESITALPGALLISRFGNAGRSLPPGRNTCRRKSEKNHRACDKDEPFHHTASRSVILRLLFRDAFLPIVSLT